MNKSEGARSLVVNCLGAGDTLHLVTLLAQGLDGHGAQRIMILDDSNVQLGSHTVNLTLFSSGSYLTSPFNSRMKLATR